MFKIIPYALTISFVVITTFTYCQKQPVLIVQSFEYIWQKDFNASPAPRVIIFSDDSAKLELKNSFLKAIHNYCDIMVSEFSCIVKPLPLLSNSPKFKTVIKNKEAGKWYLFLQVYDIGPSPAMYDYGEDAFSTTLELKCKLINGDNDSVIIDRSLTVYIYKKTFSPDQIPLTRLPAYPASFVQSFDSIAAWLFAKEFVNEKKIRLTPAYVYEEPEKKDKTISVLSFESNNDSIHLLTSPGFTFHTPGPVYLKTNTKYNTGGHIAGGVFTALTGVRTNKNKFIAYEADFPFENGNNIYHCFINYFEAETAQREREKVDNGNYTLKNSGYSFVGRYITPDAMHAIILNNDTITFNIRYTSDVMEHKKYPRLWDGSDITTVMLLPEDWNNTAEETNVIISGKIGADTFLMKTSRERRIKEFYVNDKLIMVIKGNKEPVTALIFQPVSDIQLKTFTILSSLPYSYFNYNRD